MATLRERANEKLAQRATLINAARKIVDAAEGRDWTSEETQEYERHWGDIDRLKTEADRLVRQADAESGLEERQNEPNRPDPEERMGRPENRGNPLASDEYRGAFWRQFRHTKNALEAPEMRALAIGTDPAGGYTVPDEFERTLIQGLEERNVMRGLATVIRSESGTREIPVVSSHGTAAWTGEAAAYTESDEAFGQVTLGAHKAATIMKVSEELLNDSAFNLEAYIAGEFARRIGALEETGFVNGSGTAQPTGVVGRAEEGKVGATGQTASITTDDLMDLFHALGRPYRPAATWLMADGTAKAVRKLKDADNQYLWQPGLQAGQPDRLLARPVEISDDVPAMAASAKSVLFGDFSYYWISDRQGRVFQRLGELYAANGQVGFRAFQRVDGNLILTETVKYYQNSAT